MKWSVGTKIGASFGLALAILLGLGVVTHRSTTMLVGTMGEVEESLRLQGELQEVVSSLHAAEAAWNSTLYLGQEHGRDRLRGHLEEAEKHLHETHAHVHDAEQRRRVEAITPAITGLLAEFRSTADAHRPGGGEATSLRLQVDDVERKVDSIHRAIAEIEMAENQTLAQRDAASRASARSASRTVVVGVLLAFILLGAAGLFLTRDIARPLRALTSTAERIADGDLTTKLTAGGRSDEVGALGVALSRMVESLRGSTHRIQEAVGVLSSSASEIVAAVTQVTSGATETAAAVSETATTVEEVKQTAQVSSQKAKQVSEGAQRSVNASQAGEQSVHETIDGMNRIREQMESIATSIVRLSEQSQAIGEIIATVNDLAEQSNLLAVNASIEAARAGEQGKGFAVVAQEVKVLAEQSKQATGQVRTILSDIQKATGAAVMAIEQGGKAVEAGVKQSTETGDSIQSLARNVVEAAQAIVQIEASSRQQLLGMDQVAVAMDNIKTASVQNVSSMNQVETAAKNLQDLGHSLRQLVQHYKV
jgi:methyl-accepting chemotaxis protein